MSDKKELTREYGEDQIQVLEGLEAVRKRPGMYIGNVDTKGLHHLIWEVLDNSIDEALAGYADKLTVTVKEDQSVIIEDNGRGIPTGVNSKTGISTIETVFTVLHAGGKFGGEGSGYKVSGGLHGVGASVVNALSDFLNVEVKRHGKIHRVEFKNGGEDNSGIRVVGEAEGTGTKVHFKPSFELFYEDARNLDEDIIEQRIKQTAFLNKGMSIIYIDERHEINKEFKYDGGIVDFLDEIAKDIETITSETIYNEGQEQSVAVEVAMRYTTAYQPRILSFVNNISTTEGGTHVRGFIDAVLRILNNYVKTNLPAKEQQTFKRDDVLEGLTAVVSIKHPDPIYEGQTKAKFANQEVRKIVNDVFSAAFEKYMVENPAQAGMIIAKVKLAAKSRVAAQKAKEITRKKDTNEFGTLPGKLAACQSKDPALTELFIVEGDSAGGSAKMGRDRNYQAILPLRGKVINAERARIDKLFNNAEITAMITAFGTGIGEEFNYSKLRYGKLVIMTDADVDGAHIRTLILTFLYRYFKELIEKGHVYIAVPPLYKIGKGNSAVYVYTEDQKISHLATLAENAKPMIQRYKGLGEMSDQQLWETTMDPEDRKMLQVTIEDAAGADQIFSDLMGDVVEPRRDFIESNAKYADLDV